MKKILCIISNGFEDLETIGTIDICRRGKIEVDLFGLNSNIVIGSNKTELHLNIFDFNQEISDYDMIFIPGGPHYKELILNENFKSLIKNFYQNNKKIAAICAAPTILGTMGLLRNKKYTCYTSMNKDFGGKFVDTHVVADNQIITARGPASPIELGLKIVEVLCGEEVLKNVKNGILY